MRILAHYYCYYSLCLVLLLKELFVLQTSAQSGFISINCGGEDYHDINSTIRWKSDVYSTAYISYGNVADIQSDTANNVSVPLTTLRYFNKGSKSCYTFKDGAIYNGTIYLVRASFLYGNYDKLNNPPSFALLLNYDVWVANVTTTLTETITEEIIYYSALDSLSICLVPAAGRKNDTPFISTLEIRPLSSTMYVSSSNTGYSALVSGYGLRVLRRINYGASSSQKIRYPDDNFDRIWEANTTGTILATSDANINSNDVSDPLHPPAKVMATAMITPNNSPNYNLSFDFPDISGAAVGFRIDFHFAELLSKPTNRTVSIYINSASLGQTYSLGETYSIHPILTPCSFTIDRQAQILPDIQIVLVPNTSVSNFGPLLNGIEVMKWTDDPLAISGTFQRDSDAIQNICNTFNLQSYGDGDPCTPSSYSWTWITCNGDTPPRIIGLNLSNFNLIGTIPQSINLLSKLETIDLSNNKLSGTIPNLTSLTSLQVLDLHNNSLNGEIPQSLNTLSTLETLNVKDNNLCGDIPIFKQKTNFMYDGNSNLCVGCKCHVNKQKIIVFVALPSMLTMGVMGALLFYMLRIKMNMNKKDYFDTNEVYIEGSYARSVFNDTRRFNYDEIVDATKCFSIKLGEGGFGPVFKGVLRNGEEVAVKMMLNKSQHGIQQFFAEVSILSKVRHKNLVSLLGICIERTYMLIYEYIPNGTLYDLLHNDEQEKLNVLLPWNTRLQIAVGISQAFSQEVIIRLQGLEYLHTSCQPAIIHRDIKSKNILLVDDTKAKLADFGLSRLKITDEVSHVSTTHVGGTIGYLDPMYHNTSQLTYKSDIYSFGVVLLELICNKPPIFLVETTPTHIATWVRTTILEGKSEDLVDPSLINKNNVDSICSTLDVALQCVEYDRNSRPYIGEVVIKLKEAQKLQMEDHM